MRGAEQGGPSHHGAQAPTDGRLPQAAPHAGGDQHHPGELRGGRAAGRPRARERSLRLRRRRVDLHTEVLRAALRGRARHPGSGGRLCRAAVGGHVLQLGHARVPQEAAAGRRRAHLRAVHFGAAVQDLHAVRGRAPEERGEGAGGVRRVPQAERVSPRREAVHEDRLQADLRHGHRAGGHDGGAPAVQPGGSHSQGGAQLHGARGQRPRGGHAGLRPGRRFLRKRAQDVPEGGLHRVRLLRARALRHD
mmetsp:Transcript_33291/g.55833  ORF Transcript_33291/g.55833 Transcript_33291/m.55833 type:complete len:249 (-) Transcript_33291:2109-2855(-)